MKTDDSMTKSWDDVVFENRNKEYGAYVLRRSYSRNISEAAAATILFGVLLFLYSHFIGYFGTKAVNNEKNPLGIILDPPPIIDRIDIRPKQIQPPAKKVQTNTVPILTSQQVEDANVLTEPHAVDNPNAQEGNGTPVAGESTGIMEATAAPTVIPPTIFTHSEIMPSYEGGLDAMFKFIRKHLQYPRVPKMMGIEGSVFIQFIVNADGRVIDAQIIKGIHRDCDKEVLRVISMMPNWKPGMNNKIPVSVRMILPIKFELQN